MSSKTQVPAILILAAGEGTRMHSELPKVLSDLGGRPMIFWILDCVRSVFPKAEVGLVVGYQHEKVKQVVSSRFSDLKLSFIIQEQRLGTGDAARVAIASNWGEKVCKAKSSIMVLPGDQPLIRPELLEQMGEPLGRGQALRLMTVEMVDPSGYGRVVRKGREGPVQKIVEHRDATQRQRSISEVATSVYLFNPGFLKAGTRRLSNKNAQKEFYLTDLVAQASRLKKKTDVLRWTHSEDLLGVNTSWQLAQAGKLLNERCLKAWALRGVKFIDPSNTWIDARAEIGTETTIYPGSMICGNSKVGRGVIVGPNCVVRDSNVEDGVELKPGSVIEKSSIRKDAKVGPYAHLRPDSDVGERCKIGNFVELKKTKISSDTSVAHLSYLGDAEVGSECNIGCGFVTCNFDGRVVNGQRKHKTIIEDRVFIGSDCQVIAPIRLKAGAYVASGSTITKDVESDDLVFARSRQVAKKGYARTLMKRMGDEGTEAPKNKPVQESGTI